MRYFWKNKTSLMNTILTYDYLYAIQKNNCLYYNNSYDVVVIITFINWIINPFSYDFIDEVPLDKESFIDIISDSSLKDAFKVETWVLFWMSKNIEYPSLCKQALKCLILFIVIYLY